VNQHDLRSDFFFDWQLKWLKNPHFGQSDLQFRMRFSMVFQCFSCQEVNLLLDFHECFPIATRWDHWTLRLHHGGWDGGSCPMLWMGQRNPNHRRKDGWNMLKPYK
jgi:hypothetical protein